MSINLNYFMLFGINKFYRLRDKINLIGKYKLALKLNLIIDSTVLMQINLTKKLGRGNLISHKR